MVLCKIWQEYFFLSLGQTDIEDECEFSTREINNFYMVCCNIVMLVDPFLFESGICVLCGCSGSSQSSDNNNSRSSEPYQEPAQASSLRVKQKNVWDGFEINGKISLSSILQFLISFMQESDTRRHAGPHLISKCISFI